MAKQLNVNMSLTADTSQAKKALNELQQSLNKIQTTPPAVFDDASLERASKAASDLQKHLQACTDVNTGKLDLTKFATSLKTSGQSLKSLRLDLEAIGPDGSQAFLSLAKSIASADAPMFKLNSHLTNFMTTLKNTARWQISSSVLHGLMGGVQSAYYYAQDLNESLNKIRIVTGQSTEEMATFASTASKAANALNTSTTSYTDAALIFYQQGLSDDLVKEYTDVTIKMANVTGDGAQEVSSYMTAIWNNFNKDGDESAEHFADVITALGATTASSSAEIAAGLEKFASIADVTGLSYDYATSALATLVANTRQSADVVGTSLKTIFSRMEGLKLGDTLEDGVDLNKYSEALQTIGVNVLDASGNLKNLDDILDDTASKWDNLSRAQQMAVAQTVAGVRQYNNFISLMDNWDDMQTNLQTAATADGSLQEQADIYAESWRAAKADVQNSLQALYDDLLDDKFFIGITKGFAKFIDGIDGVVEGLGGVKGILLLIGNIFAQKFAREMPAFLNTLKQDFMILTGQADKLAKQMQQDALKQVQNVSIDTTGDYAATAQVEATQGIIKMKTELAAKNSTLSQQEREIYENMIAQVEGMYQIIERQGESINKQQEEIAQEEKLYSLKTAEANLKAKGVKKTDKDYSKQLRTEQKLITDQLVKLKSLQSQYASISVVRNKIGKQVSLWDKDKRGVDEVKKKIHEYVNELEKTGKINVDNKVWKELKEGVDKDTLSVKELKDALMTLESTDEAWTSGTMSAKTLEQQIDAVHNKIVEMGGDSVALEQLKTQFESGAISIQEYNAKLDQLRQKTEQTINHQTMLSERIMGVAQGAMALGQIINAMQSFADVFSEDSTTMEKVTAGLGAIASITFGVISLQKALTTVFGQATAAKWSDVIATNADTGAKTLNTAALWANTLALLSNPFTAGLAIASIAAAAVIMGTMTAAVKKNTEEVNKNAQAAYEHADALKEEAEENRDNLKTMNELLEVYKETGEGKDDLDAITKTLADSYDLEGAALAKLTGKYEDYNKVKEASIKAREKELRERLSAEEDAVDKSAGKVRNKLATDVDLDGGGNHLNGNKLELTLDGWGYEQPAEDILNRYFTDLNPDDFNDFKLEADLSDPTSILETYDNLLQARLDMENELTAEQLQDYGIYEDLTTWLDAMEAEVEELRTHMQEVQDLKLQLGQTAGAENIFSDLENVQSYSDYSKWVQDTKTALEGLGYTEDEVKDKIALMTEQSLNPAVGKLQETYEAANDLSALKGLDADKVGAYIEGLSDQEQALFWNIDFDEYQTEEEWDAQMEFLQAKADEEAIIVRTEVANTAADELVSKNEISDDTRTALTEQFGEQMDWDKFDASSAIEQLRMINDLSEKEVGNLTDQYDAYKQMLAQQEEAKQKDQERVEELKKRLEELQAQQEKTTPNAQGYRREWECLEEDIQAVNAELEELANKNYDLDIDVNIDDTLLDQFNIVVDDIVTEADALRQAAELIGEGFIVAAEDAKTLARVYPELMENATVYEDGRVQLDKAAVQAILGNESAILEADKDTVKGQLENKIALLDAEIAYYQTKADLLQQALEGDITYEQLNEQLAQAEADFETKAAEWAGEEEVKACAASVDASLDNLQVLDEKIAAISEHYSRMLSGDVVSASDKGSTSTDYSYTANQMEGSGFDSSSEYQAYLQSQLDVTNSTLDSLEHERAQLVALEAELNSTVDKATKAMDSAAAGTGGKIDDKKSGGSGSKAKEKTTKDGKEWDDELDRYHEIKEALEDIERIIKRVDKAKGRAWGAGRIVNINRESAALKQQVAILQKYKSEAEKNLAADRAKAQGYGWSFGADGTVSGYEATLSRLLGEYNDAVSAYNAAEAGSDAEKAAGKNVEAAQKKFDEAKKALERYEESADLVRDLEQQIIDASYEIADLKLEAIEYTVELKLDFDERQLKLFEDIMKDFGDMADHALDKITEIEKCIGVIFDEMATNKNGISQMLGLAGVNGGTIASLINGGELTQGQAEEIAKKMQEENGDLNYDQIMSDIEGYMDELISLNDQLREYREQVFATLEAAIDEYIDDLDRANDKIAKITKLTQGYKDLIQSIGKANVDATGELTKALNKALEDEAKSAITAAKAKEDFAKTTLDDAKALYQTAVESGDEWAINRAEEVLKKAEDEYAEALEESQSATKAFVDAVATSFKDSIEQVITDLDKNLGGLKHLREQFDQSKELDAQYIEDYTKIYELSKLTRQVQSSMDETDNIRAKKELLEFQKEINAYQEQGVQMSEYELEYLQKRYELKLAEIALQEAQNAKSQVSMVQDNEGNYSYVYTADDQAVADAQQNYEDKLYALQLLNGQYINELQDNIITMQEEMSARLQEIADDETLSDEERIERIEETREYYLERLAFYDEQLALSLENNKSLYENEWLDYHEKTGYKISANKDYVDSWEETSIAILTNVKTQGEYMNMLQESLTQASNTAKDCCQESINKLNEVGLTTSNLTTIVNGATAQLTSDAQAIATGAQMMSAQYQSAINQIMASVQAFTAQYASMITQSIANNQRLIASMQMVIQMAAAMAAALGAHVGGGGGGVDPGSGGPGANPGNNNPGSNTPGNGQDPGSTSKTADAATIAGIAASIWMDGQKSGWGNDPIRSGKVTAEYNAATATAVQQYINQHGPNGDIYSQWAGNRDQLKQYYASYDTGGYTGAWGTSEGKLAMLHQKELVLNAADTSNMLAIVDMVRDISSMIDLNAMSSMINTGLSAVTANLNNEGTLEQEVHITAEFPNATDKNEILEAFDNVINLAAQYANRK